MIEEADIVADWQTARLRRARQHGRRLRRRHPRRVRRGRPADRGDAARAPRPPRPRASAPPSPAGCRTKAREQGSTVIGMPVPEGSPGDRLLEALGYHVRWNSWVLAAAGGATVPERALPDGLRRRRRRRRTQYQQCWTVLEDAFLEWSVRERETFEDWRASTVPAARLRAVAPAGRHRPGRRRRRPWRCCRGTADRPTSPASPPAATSAAGGWPRRSWSTPSPRGARTAPRSGALHGLPHRRARPLREGRHGGHLELGEPRDRGLRPCPSRSRCPTGCGRGH